MDKVELAIYAWSAFFAVLTYMIGILLTYDNIREYIWEYIRHNRYSSRTFFSVDVDYYVQSNEKKIIAFFNVFFPLYIAFRLGEFYARKAYNILIDNNDENRIASWVF